VTIPTRESAARALPKLERSAGDAPGLEGRGPLRLLFVCFTILAVGFFLRALHIVWKYDVDWEPDGYQHVLYAQSVFAAPPASLWYGIDVWAKPLYTFVVALYAALLPATLARVPAVQLLNTLFWFLTMALVIRIVYEHGRERATVIALSVIGAFTYMFFRDSVSANTEPMGAFIFACGLWLWQKRRRFPALLLFGALVLVRLDAALIGLVFWVAAVRDDLREKEPRSFSRAAVASFLFFAPVALWNFAGFVHTGSPVFILSHGYKSVGSYGYGRPFHFVVEFLKFDTAMFASYLAGLVRIGIARRARDRMLVLLAIATGLHFICLSAMWVFGVASAGLLRYFVFAYPAYLVVAGEALDWLFRSLGGVSRRLVPATVVFLLILTVGELHWLLRPPEWHHNMLTSVPENRFRFLPENPAVRSAKVIYTDRPEVLYYLHRHFLSPDIASLQRVRDPSARGLFIFIQGWSETYAQVRREEFLGLEQLDWFDGPYGEVVYLFRR
jgi:hypothetical protein